MVSIGTIFSVIVVGAAVAGGYALYRNADKIGGALSRGVETNLTNPIGNYFDNLWTNAQSTFGVAPGQPGQGINPGTIFDPLPPAYGTNPPQPKPTPVPVPSVNYPGLPPSYQNPPASNLPNPNYPTPAPKPTPVTSKDEFKSGYYYINYKGSEFDTQWKLTAAQAKQTAKAASAPGDWLYGIHYIGGDKLGDKGFETFGKSKNYL